MGRAGPPTCRAVAASTQETDTAMSAFWIAGIGINAICFGALIYWALKNWRRDNESATKPRDKAR